MDLRIKGHAAKPLEVGEERELAPADLAELLVPRQREGRVARMRDRHHELARAIAAGMRYAEASEITGYSQGYISRLLNSQDSAFQELLTHYRGREAEGFADLKSRATLALRQAVEGIIDAQEDSLEGTGPELTPADYRQNIGAIAPLAGFGRGGVAVQVNVGIAERLAAARERAGLSAPKPVLEASPRELMTPEATPPPVHNPQRPFKLTKETTE